MTVGSSDTSVTSTPAVVVGVLVVDVLVIEAVVVVGSAEGALDAPLWSSVVPDAQPAAVASTRTAVNTATIRDGERVGTVSSSQGLGGDGAAMDL
ncbi:MAG: hypothetical protein IPM45_07805 [Acidimicrobiales bacterium]|nr:hypothetical protein [Acidimicrobiales bacterium]